MIRLSMLPALFALSVTLSAIENCEEPERKNYTDCNKNGIPDDVDIAVGSSSDDNLNGIPDECELRD